MNEIKNAKRIVVKINGEEMVEVRRPYFVKEDGRLVLKAKSLSLILENEGKSLFSEEELKGENLEAFSLNETQFDVDTYYGRFRTFLKVSNPMHAFYSNDKIREFQ